MFLQHNISPPNAVLLDLSDLPNAAETVCRLLLWAPVRRLEPYSKSSSDTPQQPTMNSQIGQHYRLILTMCYQRVADLIARRCDAWSSIWVLLGLSLPKCMNQSGYKCRGLNEHKYPDFYTELTSKKYVLTLKNHRCIILANLRKKFNYKLNRKHRKP